MRSFTKKETTVTVLCWHGRVPRLLKNNCINGPPKYRQKTNKCLLKRLSPIYAKVFKNSSAMPLPFKVVYSQANRAMLEGLQLLTKQQGRREIFLNAVLKK